MPLGGKRQREREGGVGGGEEEEEVSDNCQAEQHD